VVSLVRAALETDFDGHEAFNVFGPNNFLGVETTTAIEAGYGSLPDNCELSGEESAYSTAKAESMLGWTPEYTWETAEGASIDGPVFV
jgi:nucleoside-diphosphate-sugar epimerase